MLGFLKKYEKVLATNLFDCIRDDVHRVRPRYAGSGGKAMKGIMVYVAFLLFENWRWRRGVNTLTAQARHKQRQGSNLKRALWSVKVAEVSQSRLKSCPLPVFYGLRGEK